MSKPTHFFEGAVVAHTYEELKHKPLAELREIASLLASPDPQPPRRRSRLALVRSTSDSLFPLS